MEPPRASTSNHSTLPRATLSNEPILPPATLSNHPILPPSATLRILEIVEKAEVAEEKPVIVGEVIAAEPLVASFSFDFPTVKQEESAGEHFSVDSETTDHY